MAVIYIITHRGIVGVNVMHVLPNMVVYEMEFGNVNIFRVIAADGRITVDKMLIDRSWSPIKIED